MTVKELRVELDAMHENDEIKIWDEWCSLYRSVDKVDDEGDGKIVLVPGTGNC